MCSDYFQLLSDELVVFIFQQLDSFSLFQCSHTCRRWRRLAAEKRLWERLSQRLPLLRIEELFQGDHRKACLHRAFQQKYPVNRILTTLKDSTIVTCKPDGTDIHIVAKANSQESNFKQPCWDPFGKSILFTYFHSFASHICVVVDSHGKRKELAVSTPPFYYLWLSDGHYFTFIAEHGAAPLCLYLSTVLDEIALPVELCGLNTFFFDTCSHEDYLVAHINGDTIALLNLKSIIRYHSSSHQESHRHSSKSTTTARDKEIVGNEHQVILSDHAGYFAAPQWISNKERGDFILYLEKDDNIPNREGLQADRLLLCKVNLPLLDIEYRRELGMFLGRKAFHMTSHMKYISILEESTTQVALPNVQNPTRLQVYRLDDHWNKELIVFTKEYIWNEGCIKSVCIQQFQGVRAFQWSPDYEKLLCLVIQSLEEEGREESNHRGGGRRRKWESYFLVLDIPQQSIYRYPNLILSSTFVCNFLPFFDQFIKSQTFWSPHSDAFCYVGQHENAKRYGIEEEQGLFVQYLFQSPQLLLRNVEYATWSPL
ncbi:hypothetical protein GpartN1_g6481.t1 [Galdieria partita]|uniref:F-box domain-containing protein n=1 Tax=Galdieria partita TaxID=83374 RepID=A0A9C7Q267_9RHOD|nr:hypothetical protein GpartN1_g6481.t1 [Galdieria partita]